MSTKLLTIVVGILLGVALSSAQDLPTGCISCLDFHSFRYSKYPHSTIFCCALGTYARYHGTLSIRPPDPDSEVEHYRGSGTRILNQFTVDTEKHGQGIGRALHDHAMMLAKRDGSIQSLPTNGLVAEQTQ